MSLTTQTTPLSSTPPLGYLWRAIVKYWRLRRACSRDRRVFCTLSDHELKDIGLRRDDLNNRFRKI